MEADPECCLAPDDGGWIVVRNCGASVSPEFLQKIMNVNFAVTPCSGEGNLNAFTFSILFNSLTLDI